MSKRRLYDTAAELSAALDSAGDIDDLTGRDQPAIQAAVALLEFVVGLQPLLFESSQRWPSAPALRVSSLTRSA